MSPRQALAGLTKTRCCINYSCVRLCFTPGLAALTLAIANILWARLFIQSTFYQHRWRPRCHLFNSSIHYIGLQVVYGGIGLCLRWLTWWAAVSLQTPSQNGSAESHCDTGQSMSWALLNIVNNLFKLIFCKIEITWSTFFLIVSSFRIANVNSSFCLWD